MSSSISTAKVSVKISVLISVVSAALFFSIVFNANASAISKPPNNLGLVGYWSFNDATSTPDTRATTVTDFSGNGNHGKMTNMDPRTDFVAGKRGKALDFDGTDDDINIVANGTAIDLDDASAVSLAAWVFIDTYPGIGNIAGRDGGSIVKSQYILRLGDSVTLDKIQWIINVGVNEVKLFTTQTVSQRRWYHVVGTWDGTTQRIYLNGAQDGSQAQSGTLQASTEVFNIAASSDSTRLFDGLIDEVRVYNRALSADEVQRLYQSR